MRYARTTCYDTECITQTCCQTSFSTGNKIHLYANNTKTKTSGISIQYTSGLLVYCIEIPLVNYSFIHTLVFTRATLCWRVYISAIIVCPSVSPFTVACGVMSSTKFVTIGSEVSEFLYPRFCYSPYD